MFIIDSNDDALRLNDNELCDAKSLGVISPNSNRTKVSNTVITTNSNQTEVPKSTICPIARSSNRIMATLTKLLVMSMDAKRRSELLSRVTMRRSEGLSDSLICLSSSGESEKNAISDAETNPETARRSRAVTIAMTDPTVGE